MFKPEKYKELTESTKDSLEDTSLSEEQKAYYFEKVKDDL